MLFVFVAAVASAEAPPHTITVGGSAHVAVSADRGQFTVGVSTRAATVSAALHANNEKTQRVIDALKARGVSANERHGEFLYRGTIRKRATHCRRVSGPQFG